MQAGCLRVLFALIGVMMARLEQSAGIKHLPFISCLVGCSIVLQRKVTSKLPAYKRRYVVDVSCIDVYYVSFINTGTPRELFFYHSELVNCF